MSTTLHSTETTFTALRTDIFNALRVITVAIGTLALFFSFIISVKNGDYFNTLFLVFMFVIALMFFFIPGLNARARFIGIGFITFAIAAKVLLVEGLNSTGPMWLITFSTVIGVLLGRRAAYMAILMSLGAVILVAALSSAGLLVWHVPDMTDWMYSADRVMDFALLLIGATLPAVFLLNRLSQALASERTRKEELSEANRRLERLYHDVATYDYSASNALKVPLRHISSYAQLLLDDEADALSPAGRRFLEKINVKTRDMDRMLNELFAYSRASRQPIDPQQVNVESLISTLEQKYKTSEPQRRVEVSVEGGLQLRGDPQLLRDAFNIIFDLCWERTRTVSSGHISIGSVDWDGRDALRISDNGPALDPDCLDDIFIPYHAFHTGYSFDGDGLALPTLHRIIKRHGGRIKICCRQKTGLNILLCLN